jgi:hypothetical protein
MNNIIFSEIFIRIIKFQIISKFILIMFNIIMALLKTKIFHYEVLFYEIGSIINSLEYRILSMILKILIIFFVLQSNYTKPINYEKNIIIIKFLFFYVVMMVVINNFLIPIKLNLPLFTLNRILKIIYDFLKITKQYIIIFLLFNLFNKISSYNK